ncbi:DEAD/DEAH box helicase family protein [Kitasatospora sp. MAP12-44]|uniref:DEAD/DEAH box helicase family protein n=1 Tax=Kitasatospora sp. MAP12-9 TaxID=3035100 RepID=UPI002476DEF5|nr:DEAD/DEAH box helicase family protein [Kitasatospora sp. MAP12-44]
MFATYTSAGAVEDAYKYWAERQGELLPPLGLMVCDEAHRSSGSVEKTWTLVHDQAAIPAERRLYMTATPRIWAPPKRPVKGREDAHQPLSEELAVSMDDVRIYGPHAYSLSLAEAIDHKLLAPFEIVVLELRDPLGDPQAAEQQGVPWGPGVGEALDGSNDEVPAERIAADDRRRLFTGVRRRSSFPSRRYRSALPVW